ncbi:uncharacterized [Tachysurus ichikawai]
MVEQHGGEWRSKQEDGGGRGLTEMPASSLLKRRRERRNMAPPQTRKVVMVNYWDVAIHLFSAEEPQRNAADLSV